MNTIPAFRPTLVPGAIQRPARSAATRRAEGALPPSAPDAASSATRPVAGTESPENTDMQSILTAEERDFFTARAVLGSLSYRPRSGAAETLAPPTGQRIDVRG